MARDGAASLTLSGVARELGAPSGSIYHRFESRDLLVATLWIRTVERFQASLGAALAVEDPLSCVRALATAILEWCRSNPTEARLLLFHRSTDLLAEGWPAAVADRNRRQRARVARMLDDLCDRLGARSDADRRRVAFAAIDVPYAAARAALLDGKVPPPAMDAIVDDAVVAVVSAIVEPAKTP